jgi:hypothetical protein
MSAYDGMPLGADVANAALVKLLDLAAAVAAAAHTSASEQLRVLNQVARAELDKASTPD